jgi:branched-chain amino acid transport system substrate-binding protein
MHLACRSGLDCNCGRGGTPRAKLVRVPSWLRAIAAWLPRAPWGAAMLLLTTVIACGNPELATPSTTPTAAPEASQAPGQLTYKIGLLASLTGPYASRGIAARNAVRLAAQQVNASGGVAGRIIELLVEDDRGDASQAVSALKNVVNADAVAIIGPTTDTAAVAVLPLLDEANVPAISLAPDQSQFQPAHKFVYVVAPPPALVARGLLSYLEQSKIRNIALLRETSAYGTTGMNELQGQGGKFGVQLIVDEPFGINDTDLSRQLKNVKNNPLVEALVVWASTGNSAAAVIIRQVHELGLTVPVLLTIDQADASFLQAAGGSAEAAILEAGKPELVKYLTPTDPSRQSIDAFTSAYTQATGTQPDRYAAMAYDAFQIAVGALRSVGPAPDQLVAELDKTSSNGVAGPYGFSPTEHAGTKPSAMAMAAVRSGEFVPIQPNCEGCAETTVSK